MGQGGRHKQVCSSTNVSNLSYLLLHAGVLYQSRSTPDTVHMQSIAAVLLAVAFGSELTSWGASAIPLNSFDEQRRQMADDHRRAVQVRAANADERRLLRRVPRRSLGTARTR